MSVSGIVEIVRALGKMAFVFVIDELGNRSKVKFLASDFQSLEEYKSKIYNLNSGDKFDGASFPQGEISAATASEAGAEQKA